MDINEQIANSVAEDLRNLWGGKMPTWDDFKTAAKKGRVKANKTVAAQVINKKGIPIAYSIIYGVLTLLIGFLIIPATMLLWFFLDFSAWWLLVSVFGAVFFVKLSRAGHCEGMIHAAEGNEKIYELLVNNGAFLFSPDPTENRKS